MSDPAALIRLAFAAYERDDLGDAERLCRAVVAADEQNFDAHHLLAVVATRLGREEEALASYGRALALQPGHVQALSNNGVILDDLRRYEEAVASFDRALSIRPDYRPALSNRGNALGSLGRFDEALASYDNALALQADFADCRFNRALLLLLRGAFGDGWRDYESRRNLKNWVARAFDAPEWRGEDLHGKRVLLYAEQGLGDTIQFARFARLLAERGGDIIIEVQSPLGALMRSLTGVAQIVRQGEVVPAIDFQLPLLSVPFVLGLDEARIAGQTPYLRADPARVEAWGKRLPRGEFRIGLAWQGNPRRKIDKGRSIPLAAFAPLGRIPGVRLISLQKHQGVEQLAGLPPDMRVASLGPEFDGDISGGGLDGFLDSAAAMMHLDLIVTSDNTIAHLAGALGRPVWIILKDVPDWRWLLERPDTPWYPTARLFRQTRRDDWDEVLARVAGELAGVEAEKASLQAAPSPGWDGAGGKAPPGELPAYVISLPRRADRRERFSRWNGDKGLEFRIVDAVDGQTLRRSDLVSLDIIEDETPRFSNGALGNALSHRRMWRMCVELGRPIIVFEDDAFLPDSMTHWISPIITELDKGCDIFYLGYNRDAVLSIGYGGQWSNIVFEQPTIEFDAFVRQLENRREQNAHCIMDVRLAWGILGYAIAPRGAQALLRHCFPMSTRIPVRMHGSGRVFVPDALDGVINVAVQRGLIRARGIFPPLVIGPNDKSDSDVVPAPRSGDGTGR